MGEGRRFPGVLRDLAAPGTIYPIPPQRGFWVEVKRQLSELLTQGMGRIVRFSGAARGNLGLTLGALSHCYRTEPRSMQNRL